MAKKQKPRPDIMKLTKDQEKALKAIRKWLKDPKGNWMFSLAGFAGTGKTTLLKLVIENLGAMPFVCCAPTGKAASVLRSKLPNLRVITYHQLLYMPRDPSMSELERLEAALENAKANDLPTVEFRAKIAEEKERLANADVNFKVKADPDARPGKLVICDEASMVSERMRADLEETGCRALFVGDSGQLPPVRDQSWFIDYEHDAVLTEVMRQALDSPIVRLSMDIRNGEVDSKQYQSDLCRITRTANVAHEEWLSVDQILTGGNVSRQRINRFCRKKKAIASKLPVAGDRMICLKNDHHRTPPWINGVQFTATGGARDDNGEFFLPLNYEGFESEWPFYPYHCQLHYEDVKEEPREFRKGLFEADYAYAITVHKSQGSEWESVLLADDGIQAGNKEFRKRWLYTAVTRAKSRLLIVAK